ncbi:MAG: DegQ family serine endoprotease [candidate division KSB1 bacterium]|nr:DegQ family serine endoprotease [candidate division KSB1 bacterium]
MKRSYVLGGLLLVFVGVVIGLIVASNLNWTSPTAASSPEPKSNVVLGEQGPQSQAILEAQNTSRVFVEVVKKVAPAVVTITSEKKVQIQNPWRDFFGDDFFRRFFDYPDQEYIQRGLGSGVIVSKDGYILTNHHVIKDADQIYVVYNRKEYKAKVVGSDASTDIAVVKIEADEELPVVRFGDSDKLEVGEWVLAIGSPFSEVLEHTVTHGIVSAKGRRGLNISGSQMRFQDFIQTDAAINPGNSGGALVNLRGELVGINTAIVGQANVGIGFAIPINMARWVMEQLVSKGKVVRGWLGVWIQSVDEKIAKAYGLDRPMGALVTQVQKNSPAEKAGIKEGDLILEFDGRKIEDSQHLTNLVASYPPGAEVEVVLIREKSRRTLRVKLGERPEEERLARGGSARSQSLGLSVQTLTEDLASRLGYEGERGVVISEVEPGSPAARAGLRRGDLILEANRQKVSSAREFQSLVAELKPGDVLLLRVRRGENTFFAAIEVPEEKQ